MVNPIIILQHLDDLGISPFLNRKSVDVIIKYKKIIEILVDENKTGSRIKLCILPMLVSN